jgi:hypothetical protein
VQDDTENVLLARAKWLRETTGAKNLCIAGGVGLNCVANGRIAREAGFENVWIQPASGDDGIAIGCAYYGHVQLQGKPRMHVMEHAYLGRPYSDAEVETALDLARIYALSMFGRPAELVAAARRVEIAVFASIMRDCGMNWDDLFAQYVSKNVLNFFRQDHGYKDGSYQKIWHGKEDNEHLVEVMATLSATSASYATDLYQALKLRYPA